MRGEAGTAVVILHGLLGGARNWRGVAAELAKNHRVYALDLRNHGASPHSSPFTLNEMAADVEAWIESRLPDEKVILMGHSLGGKVAMKCACHNPGLVGKLIIVDISSEAAPRRWTHVFKAMLSLDLDSLQNRMDAEERLEKNGIEGWAFRKFISSNLAQDDSGRWVWRIGLDALAASSDELVSEVLENGQRYEGPTLLVRGEKSDFAPDADLPAMREHFPALHLSTIAGAAHNIHVESPRLFLDAVRAFIEA
ncbi:MAG: alpha/beta fold hydrolase [Opitutales bacterium]|nr:alpha/beta fold hydrolase [Opitutales bacterium]